MTEAMPVRVSAEANDAQQIAKGIANNRSVIWRLNSIMLPWRSFWWDLCATNFIYNNGGKSGPSAKDNPERHSYGTTESGNSRSRPSKQRYAYKYG